MGISERKEREKGEKKELIRAAATKMFLEDGYAKTSIRNIADAIEYSPGTIYLYYKDKDELLYEVQADAFRQLIETFEAKVTSKDPLEKLRELGRAYISFGLDNPELYDLMFIIRAPTNVDEATHKDNGGLAFIYAKDTIKTCIDQNLIRMENVELASLQVWAMVHGLVSLNLRCRLKVIELGNNIQDILMMALDNYVDSIKV